MAPTFTEEFVQVDGARVQMFKGGSGEPLLILHGNSGNSGPTISAQMLAERYTVYMPSHPGFNQSERPEWLETMQDLASFYSWFLEKQGLEGVRAIASSMGGWLAAEIAVNCRHAFSKLMLVGAVGIQPKNSEITDVFLITPEQVTELIIHDPKQVPDYDQIYGQTPTPEERYIADRNREMAVRLCWKPYMFDPSLPARLGRISHPTPHRLGPPGPYRSPGVRRALQAGHPRVGAHRNRGLRPQPPDREATGVREAGPRVSRLTLATRAR